jgi:hypothetical protein
VSYSEKTFDHTHFLVNRIPFVLSEAGFDKGISPSRPILSAPFMRLDSRFGGEPDLADCFVIFGCTMNLANDELFVHAASKESIPQGLKPAPLLALDVRAEARPYLEAKATAEADSFATLRNDNPVAVE